jgi:hypothetical protein
MYLLFRDNVQRQGNVVQAGGISVVCASPRVFTQRAFPWRHENGKLESTQGIRLETRGREGEFVTVLVSGPAAGVEVVPGGVQVDGFEVLFAGGLDAGPNDAVVTVRKAGCNDLSVTGREIDGNRFQGDIGLFVPDAGYPFGEIPDWLVRQRVLPPDWYTAYLKWRDAQMAK